MEIVTRRKTNKLFGRIPALSQDDVTYLTAELNKRKRNLFDILQRKATYRNPETTNRIALKLALINEGLTCLSLRDFSNPQKIEALKQLFDDQM